MPMILNKNMKIIDISMPLNNQTPIYPGNVPVFVAVHQNMPEFKTKSSAIFFGSQSGTHIDAPAHAILGGKTLDQIPLECLIGKCIVLDFSDSSEESITLEMFKTKIHKLQIEKGDRVIFKTRNSIRGFDKFYPDYIYLSGDAAVFVADMGVVLVGIDALSIKQKGSLDHRPHLALLSKDIPIIEGLNLINVDEGEYEIFCPPLFFTDIDGAPARAILLS